MNNLKLTIEMVPSSSWNYNLREILKPSMWNAIRKKVYEKSNFKCSICERRGNLHAHEVWNYDDKYHIQKLKDIVCLCYLCHMVKHIGFASFQKGSIGADMEIYVRHFMKVNNCDRLTFQNHLKSETEKFNERSRYEWQIDLEKLKDFE